MCVKPNQRKLQGFGGRALCGFFLALIFSSCASEPKPVYVPVASTFDRAWSAAVNATRDEGVQVLFEDRAGGVISGSKGEQGVTINMRAQADGSVRLEISQRGPQDADPGLASRISQAYDRRMGR